MLLEENVRAARDPFPPEIVARLNAARQPLLEKFGGSFNSYERRENNHMR